MAKKNNLTSKVNVADDLFSVLIRLKGMDDQGYCQCFTCGKYFYFKDIDCGHFIPRAHYTTRWLEENARPQCKKCNYGEHGNYDIFKASLEEEQPGVTDYLEALARETANITKSDMDRIIETLRKRVKEYGGLQSVPKK